MSSGCPTASVTASRSELVPRMDTTTCALVHISLKQCPGLQQLLHHAYKSYAACCLLLGPRATHEQVSCSRKHLLLSDALCIPGCLCQS